MKKVKYYKGTRREDGSIFLLSQRKCPFRHFEKCIGEECALFSITGFRDDEGIEKDFGECALVKLPGFLIDIKNTLGVVNSEALRGKREN
ncbi:hypothetical protein ES702_07238 [subsurface metagenome]